MTTESDDRDLIAELDALRAELDALKRAFMAEALTQKLSQADRPLIVAEAVEAATRAMALNVDAPDPDLADGKVEET